MTKLGKGAAAIFSQAESQTLKEDKLNAEIRTKIENRIIEELEQNPELVISLTKLIDAVKANEKRYFVKQQGNGNIVIIGNKNKIN